MSENEKESDDLRAMEVKLLRERAESRTQHGEARELASFAPGSLEAYVPELQTRRIELELQNEDLREAQLALIEARDKYANLYDFSPIGYLTLSEDHIILMANVTLANMLNIPRGKLYSQSLPSFIAKEDQDVFYFHCANIHETQERQLCELRLCPQDSEPIWTRIESVIETKPGAEHLQILSVISDISVQKATEGALLNMQKLESVGMLAGGIAHDFNNIMTALFGNIEIAKLNIPRNHASYPNLEASIQAYDRARHLTQQLLTFAKGGDPIMEIVDLTMTVESALSFSLSGTNVKPIFKVPDDLWLVWADKGQLDQVITNLAINAANAMPNGGQLHIDAQNMEGAVTLSDQKLSGDFVQIRIRDEGRGIPPDQLTKIFDPYFSTKTAGNGLGLAIVHSIIKKHGGHIGVESKLSKGTTFTLLLSSDRSIQKHEKKPVRSKGQDSPPKTDPLHILVMDDDVQIVQVLTQLLRAFGHSSAIAYEGSDAVAQYHAAASSEQPFDLIIMDLTIPGGMGGQEAVMKILALNPDAKVIVASGYSTDTVMANYQGYGFKGRLVKPFNFQELRDEITRTIESD
jgi:two-component system, cell cycle sensor histidine kinase and response regulator CckA